MQFTVERNWIEVIGGIWMPYGAKAAQRIDLSSYDMENIGDPTRDNVEDWLGTHTGDFSSVDDFYAVVGETEIPWTDEESEFTYHDCIYGTED